MFLAFSQKMGNCSSNIDPKIRIKVGRGIIERQNMSDADVENVVDIVARVLVNADYQYDMKILSAQLDKVKKIWWKIF